MAKEREMAERDCERSREGRKIREEKTIGEKETADHNTCKENVSDIFFIASLFGILDGLRKVETYSELRSFGEGGKYFADTFSKFSSHHRQNTRSIGHHRSRQPLPTPPSPNTTGCAIAHHRPVRTAVQRCHRRRPVRPPVPPAPSSSSAPVQQRHRLPPPSSPSTIFSDSPANRSEVTADAAALPPPKMLYDALPPPALPHS
nr:hypothetical protein Iba_chr09bCG13650 [Ipomoea batatas]